LLVPVASASVLAFVNRNFAKNQLSPSAASISSRQMWEVALISLYGDL